MATIHDKLKNQRGTIFIHELLKEVSRCKTKEEKLELLDKYSKRDQTHNKMLRHFLECVYHPAVILDLPDGAPPYRALDAADETLADSTLFREMGMVKYYVKGTQSYIDNALKRETLFTRSLEKLCPHEARLLLMIKDKKLDNRVYPGVKQELLHEAFPEIVPMPEPKPQKTKDQTPKN